MLLTFSESVELTEAVAVDNLLKGAIGIVANEAVVIEDHQLTIVCSIGFPSRETVDIRIAVVGEL